MMENDMTKSSSPHSINLIIKSECGIIGDEEQYNNKIYLCLAVVDDWSGRIAKNAQYKKEKIVYIGSIYESKYDDKKNLIIPDHFYKIIEDERIKFAEELATDLDWRSMYLSEKLISGQRK
jgi:hypothetical protein